MPVVESTAIALVLSPFDDAKSLATWDVSIVPSRGDLAWQDWVPPAWHANASARGFSALELLACPDSRVATMPLSPEIDLELTRC
jgi:hypothetical protein